MAGAAEDLQQNPLFQMFMSSELYAQAAKKQLTVCVPVAESLKVTKDVLLSHVISASPFGKDEFLTQNGKTVVFRGDCVRLLSSAVAHHTHPLGQKTS
jgi:hypothetical protein